MQTKLQSLIEAWANILVGFGVAVLAQVVCFPWFGIQVSVGSNLKIGVIFTVVSLVRSYAIRRAFNKWHR